MWKIKSLIYKSTLFYRLIKRYFYLRIKYSLFYLFGFKIGEYDDFQGTYEEIGFIDQDGLIHCDKHYHKYFNKINLYKGGEFKKREKFNISIILYNSEILIVKNYSRKLFEFYNELKILNILKDIKFIPSIKYVSYKNKTIYLELVSGFVLREKLAQIGALLRDIDMENESVSKTFEEKAIEGRKFLQKVVSIEKIVKIRKAFKIIHDKKIIVHDIKYGNIIINDKGFHLIDFETSIYFPEVPSFFFRHFKNIDQNKINLILP